MEANGTKPTHRTFLALLNACGTAGRVEEAYVSLLCNFYQDVRLSRRSQFSSFLSSEQVFASSCLVHFRP